MRTKEPGPSRRQALAGGGALVLASSGAEASAGPALSAPASAISPLDFGAPCDGVGDDQPAIQSAADTAIRAGIPLSLAPRAGGHWRLGRTVELSHLSALGARNAAMPPIVDGANAVVRPLAGTRLDTLIRCRNTANATLRNLRLDGEGRVALLLDTSWDLPGPPPARNVLYQQLELRGAAGDTSWRAHRENDSAIVSCLVAGPGTRAHTALDLQAPGGHVRVSSPEFLDGALRLSCQSATIHDAVMSGIEIVGADDNVLVLSGATYCYPTFAGHNIALARDARITAFRASGRFENAHPSGAIIGGDGRLCGGMDFDGAYFLRPGTSTRIPLVGSGVGTVADGYPQTLRLTGGMVSGIDLADTRAVRVALDGTLVDGVLRHRRIAGSHDRAEECGEALSYVQHTAAYGPAATLRSVVVRGGGAGAQARVALPDLPVAGTLSIRCTNATGPSAVYAYAKGGGTAAGVVRELVSARGAGGGRIMLVMAEGPVPTFAIGHEQADMVTDYIVALCGTS